MLAILATTFPFFALVLCGWLAAQRRWLPDSAIPGLNGFVLFFALPCLLLRFGRDTPLRQLLSPALLGVYAAAALAIVGLAMTVARRGAGPVDAAFGALVAAFPNTGFMGVPLVVALMGASAAGPVITTLLVDLFMTSSLCIAMAHAGLTRAGLTRAGQARDAGGGAAAFGRALRAALGNPLPWAIALGAALGATTLALPAPVDKAIGMLADAASPVALFTIGAVLSRAGGADRQRGASRAPWRALLPVAGLKLLAHPALVFGLGTALQHLGAPLSTPQLTALTLAAALPSASNVVMLAERYGADSGRVARIVLATTTLSFLSFSALAAWLTAAA